ncbi:hypothetical protein C789_1057 [Microcystis aeruginosa FACHB-905 = DIANCHI905]|uniref:Uncharacterized protein n=1 Tax=Microcystis aeruginosa PCC 7806SL TaxID=1903187 RepID=A0AB33C394_MICA7|nr:hypothetical protein BH695_3677 [Microcystis aeruginosa PCC 7806SL]ELS49132.1 hypothetical protein C789_1057 [Microcystis aeruginosa FACHB-905 = DIANCHI905]
MRRRTQRIRSQCLGEQRGFILNVGVKTPAFSDGMKPRPV